MRARSSGLETSLHLLTSAVLLLQPCLLQTGFLDSPTYRKLSPQTLSWVGSPMFWAMPNGGRLINTTSVYSTVHDIDFLVSNQFPCLPLFLLPSLSPALISSQGNRTTGQARPVCGS